MSTNQTCKFRYDFYLPDHNLLIEFHGGQHFKAIEYFGGEEALIYTQRNDSLKRDLAKMAGIRLIEFNYNHLRIIKEKFEKIVLNKIFLHYRLYA